MERYRGLCKLRLLLFAAAIGFAGPVFAQFNPKWIKSVPDWNQPEDYNAANSPLDSFTQPPDGPPAADPQGNVGVYAWCTPTAAANVMGWFEDTGGNAFGGLADGFVSPNRQQPYPNNDTNVANPLQPDGQPDWQQNQWMDGVIEMGWFMDTQDWQPPHANTPPPGTSIRNTAPGVMSYTAQFLPKTRWASWTMQGNNVRAGWNDYLAGNPFQQNGVRRGDPVLVHFDQWIDLDLAHGPGSGLPYSSGGIDYYDWRYPTSSIGHTVTGVGWVVGDPDGVGAKNPLPNTRWIICHDNWPATNPQGSLVAVPWDFLDENGLSKTYWMANTHVDFLGQKLKVDGEPDFDLGQGIPSASLSGVPADQWAADNWTCTTGAPIVGLVWWGAELQQGAPMEDWQFRVFDDAGGLPGGKVWEWSCGDDYVVKSPTGQMDAEGNPIFQYSVDLKGNLRFGQQRGHDYWLHVGRECPGVPDAWGWLSALGASDYAWTADGVNWSLEPTFNLAFGLLETPEPCTFVLFGLGAGALIRRRRRCS